MSERNTGENRSSDNLLDKADKEAVHLVANGAHLLNNDANTIRDSHAGNTARTEAALQLADAAAIGVAVAPTVATAAAEAVVAAPVAAAGLNELKTVGKEVVRAAQDVGHAYTNNLETVADTHAPPVTRIEATLDLVRDTLTVVGVTGAVVLAAPEEGGVAVAAAAAPAVVEVGAEIAASGSMAAAEVAAQGAVAGAEIAAQGTVAGAEIAVRAGVESTENAVQASIQGAENATRGAVRGVENTAQSAANAARSGVDAAVNAFRGGVSTAKAAAKAIQAYANEAIKAGFNRGKDFMHSRLGRTLESVTAGYDLQKDGKTALDSKKPRMERAEALGAAVFDTTGLGGAARHEMKPVAEYLEKLEQSVAKAYGGHVASTLSKAPKIVRNIVEAADHQITKIEGASTQFHKDLEHAPDLLKHSVHKVESLVKTAAHFEHVKGLGEDVIGVAMVVPGAIGNAEQKVLALGENLGLGAVRGFEHAAQTVADGAQAAVHGAKSVENKLESLKSLNENHLPNENHKQHNGTAHHVPGQTQNHSQAHGHGGR